MDGHVASDGAGAADAASADAVVADGLPAPDAAPAPDAGTSGAAHVIATQPADGATEIEPTIALAATFSADMAPASLDTSTFTATQDGAAISGAVSYDAATRTATFTPARRLALRGVLAAHIAGATDAGGAAADPAQWGFGVRDGRWGDAAQLGPYQLDIAPAVRIAFDAAGVATAVWDQNGIVAARYTPGSGWSASARIADGNTPVVAVDPQGNATAAWLNNNGTDNIQRLWGARRPAGGSWSAPTRIDNDDGYPHGVGYINDIGTDAAGDVLVVWSQMDTAGGYNLRARRFAAGAGWGAVVDIGRGVNPSLAVAPDGRAVAGWMDGNGGTTTIWGAAFDPATGWSTAVQLDPGTENAFYARVAIQPDGRAMQVWLRQSSTETSVWAAAFTPSAGWGTPVQLEAGITQVAYDAGVVALPDDTFTAVWSRWDSGSTVHLRHFVPAGGWQPTVVAETGDECRIDADRRGNAVLVWRADGSAGTAEMWASRGAPDGSWGAPVHIDSATSGDSLFPDLAISPLGTAAAVWVRSDGPEHSGSSYAPFAAAFE